MPQSSAFDQLARELETADRRRMLASIRASMESETTPVAEEPEPPPAPPEQQVRGFGLWRRLLLLFLRVVRGENREEIVRGWNLRSLAQEIDRAGGGAIDARMRVFQDGFAAALEELAAATAPMASIVGVVHTHRSDLVRALALEFFPATHRQLMRGTSDDALASLAGDGEQYLKRALGEAVDAGIAEISSDARAAMRRAMAQADVLQRIAGLRIASMVALFEQYGTDDRRCTFETLHDGLREMYETVSAIREPINLVLVERIALLSHYAATTYGDGAVPAAAAAPDSDAETSTADVADATDALNHDVAARMNTIVSALGALRRFAARFPLLPILRLMEQDPWLDVSPESSGEDWIGLYRRYFSGRVHQLVVRATLRDQMRGRLSELEEAATGSLAPVAGLPRSGAAPGARRWYLAAALKLLAGDIWQDVRPRLRILLTSGEFYKSSNRAVYDDAYNAFEQFPERIRLLEHDLQPDEAWGTAFAAGATVEARRRMAERADEEIESMWRELRPSLDTVVNVLTGVLYASPGSTYDTLANYGQIAGRRNAEFIEELKEDHRRLGAALAAIDDIVAIERRIAENGITIDPPIPSLHVRETPADTDG